MPQASKQAVEEKHGRALMDSLGFKCTLERGNEPAPDLWFRHEGRKIGVEHTRLFAEKGSKQSARRRAKRAAPLQAREILIDRIADETRLEYQKRGLPPVEVKLYISQCHIKKSDIKALADQIVDVVIRNLPDNPGRTAVDNIRDGCLPAGIDSISMIRFSKQTSVFFFAPRSGWIPMIDAAYLQRTIDEKATHLQGYLTACAEAWLLMVEEGSNPSNTVEMPDELWKHAYDFRGFARLFVLRCTRTIHEL